nr:hypothetical protein [Novosphingobium panipatense]
MGGRIILRPAIGDRITEHLPDRLLDAPTDVERSAALDRPDQPQDFWSSNVGNGPRTDLRKHVSFKAAQQTSGMCGIEAFGTIGMPLARNNLKAVGNDEGAGDALLPAAAGSLPCASSALAAISSRARR